MNALCKAEGFLGLTFAAVSLGWAVGSATGATVSDAEVSPLFITSRAHAFADMTLHDQGSSGDGQLIVVEGTRWRRGFGATPENAALTIGGEGMLFIEGHQPLLAIQRQGKGAVIFSADAELFSNSSLGSTGTMPNEMQRRLYELIFTLFREVGNGQKSEALPGSPKAGPS